MTKLTNKVALMVALNMVQANGVPSDCEFSIAEIVDKLETMIIALDKKASTPKKPTVSKVFGSADNKAMIAEHLFGVLDEFADTDYHTIDEVKVNAEFANLSVSAIASLMSMLVKNGKIERGTVKRKTGYRVIR